MSSPAAENQNQNPAVREELVQTAVKFLQNGNVVGTPLVQKQKFLQRKGLTDGEIQAACERSGAYDVHERQQTPPVPVVKSSAGPLGNYYGYGGQLQHYNWLERLKEIVHNTALISAVVYAVYMFYQKFIKPYLFGNSKKKKKTVEDTIQDLEKSVNTAVKELKTSLADVKVEVDKLSENGGSVRQFLELKSEISSVKGLLLSRKQFPAVSSNSPVVPPSIPAWQLASANQEHDQKEDLMEIGSGSGSSEHEHTTNKSDSSLEIIYSYKHDSKDDDSEHFDKQSGAEDC